MRGFPPAPAARVTHANQLYGPFNRWSFQHTQELNPTADIWRGSGPVTALDANPYDLGHVTYQRRDGTTYTLDQMVELSYTDGIVVLHRGRVVYERYLNGMHPHTRHAWASGSKSMTGTVAALLAAEGLFDLDTPITAYLPELKGSGFAGATVRHAMDMTTAATFAQDDGDPLLESRTMVENWKYSIAMGWRAKPEGYDGPATSYDLLASMKTDGGHGERFAYLTPNTDVLAWIVKRLLDKPLAEIVHERIWAHLGAERDACWVVGPTTEETAGSGLLTTARDMARFGQMMVQKGRLNGRQIVPEAVVDDIERGGSHVIGQEPAPYHFQWWMSKTDHRAYFALGFGGQVLYIDPVAGIVVAKFSSYPTPVENGEEFYHIFAALPALVEALAKV